jgi:zinc transport system substrate-binding protein
MIKHFLAGLMASCALAFAPLATAMETVRVVASIKPIHSLVAGVMEGAGEPRLLIDSGASPHIYSLKPSDARALQNVQVFFWVGEDLETFLIKPVSSLPKTARVIKLAEAPGVILLRSRESALWEGHVHTGDGRSESDVNEQDHHAAHGGADMHIWLDIDNASAIIEAIAAALVEADPSRGGLYRSNAEHTQAQLQNLDQELRSELTPIASRPYIVFHDAYHYLERRYGLTPVGSITGNPERQPSAQRVAAVRKRIIESNAVCIFSEPQFEPALVKSLIEGTSTRIGVLDAEGGIGVPPGPQAYFTIMQDIGKALKGCLGPAG